MLWAEDGQFLLNANHAYYTAMLVNDDLVLVYTNGFFRWCGFTAAMTLFSRNIVHTLQKNLKGVIDMYIGDLVGVSPRSFAEADNAEAQLFMRALLGSASLDVGKHRLSPDGDL